MNFELLCCIPETNVILYVTYTFKINIRFLKNKKKIEKRHQKKKIPGQVKKDCIYMIDLYFTILHI